MEDIIADVHFSFGFLNIMRGLLGLAVLICVAILLSSAPRQIQWKSVGRALLLQAVVAFAVLTLPPVQWFMGICGKCFVAMLGWTRAGTEFLLGPLLDTSKIGFVFVFQILPSIIFFSALTSLLFYCGILQKVTYFLARLFSKFLKISGAEGVVASSNIFVGMIEAILFAKAYVSKMSKSEIMLIMVVGMTTMAGGTLAAYIGLLGQGSAIMELKFATHLITACVMAAPSSIVFSKILVPQTDEISMDVNISGRNFGKNILDAISNGTIEGLKIVANVAAMLLVFYAFITGANYILGKFGAITTLNTWISHISNGAYSTLSLQCIMSYVFAPFVWLAGVPSADVLSVGRLLGEKVILNEMIGYNSLAELMSTGALSNPKSIIVSVYVLCGFANFGSVGMLMSSIGNMAPNQKSVISKFSLKSLVGATLAALSSAAIIGMVLA